jgi:hypothetical protein
MARLRFVFMADCELGCRATFSAISEATSPVPDQGHSVGGRAEDRGL